MAASPLLVIAGNLPVDGPATAGVLAEPAASRRHTALVTARAVAPELRIAIALTGLAAALVARIAVAGSAGIRSLPAGLIFAVLLGLVAVASAAPLVRRTPASLLRQIGVGVLGAAVLCLPAAVRHTDGVLVTLPLHGYLPWAFGVTVVALAEEALLRGTLYRALEQRYGVSAALAVTTVAFALLHVPLYGWSVFVLDLAVGFWLGTLRAISGSVVAPAIAHTVADLAGWWLR
jgi:membrane protease YdiL (CAAX protease family)